MARTGEQLLKQFSDFIGDYWAGTTTAAGAADGTTIIDSQWEQFGDDARVDWWIRITHDADTSENEERKINDNVESTGVVTVAPGFTAQIGSGKTYELHRYEPATKWQALNQAMFKVVDDLFVEVEDDTYCSDGVTTEYGTPSTIERGPFFYMIEQPFNPNSSRNFLTDADHEDSSSANWTASAQYSASDYNRIDQDHIIPKRGQTDIRFDFTGGVADATYTQTVANMNSNITATSVAGRYVVGMSWVYALSSGTVAEIITDAGTLAASSAHSGGGWQLLIVEGQVAANNATTFSYRLRTPDNTVDEILFLHHSWLSFAEDQPTIYDRDKVGTVYRDANSGKVVLPAPPPRGRQIRLVGKAFLTRLDDSTPWATSVEVDEYRAQLLCSEAAKIFFGLELINTPAFKDVANRIAIVEQDRDEYKMKLSFKSRQGGVSTPYSETGYRTRDQALGGGLIVRWR